MTTPDPDQSDRHLEIVVDVGSDVSLSPRLTSALEELAAALAAEEVNGLIDEDDLDDEVAGFSFGRNLGDLGLSPSTTGICISKNTCTPKDNRGTSCTSWCAVNTDGDTSNCWVNIW